MTFVIIELGYIDVGYIRRMFAICVTYTVYIKREREKRKQQDSLYKALKRERGGERENVMSGRNMRKGKMENKKKYLSTQKKQETVVDRLFFFVRFSIMCLSYRSARIF